MITRYTSTANLIRAGWRKAVPPDLEIVCLWALFGLGVSLLMVASGFGEELADILAKAG